MTAPQLIPTRGIYLTDEPVVIEVSDPEGHGIPAVLEVSDLGSLLRTVVAPPSGSADLGPLPRGSYGISLVCNGIQRARSAVQVVLHVRRHGDGRRVLDSVGVVSQDRGEPVVRTALARGGGGSIVDPDARVRWDSLLVGRR